MRCCVEDLILLRVTELPFIKVSVEDETKMRRYLESLPQDKLYALEIPSESTTGARKILKLLRKKI
ncbi:hypothetical protein VPHD479_0307 [Vibrio phage D479]